MQVRTLRAALPASKAKGAPRLKNSPIVHPEKTCPVRSHPAAFRPAKRENLTSTVENGTIGVFQAGGTLL